MRYLLYNNDYYEAHVELSVYIILVPIYDVLFCTQMENGCLVAFATTYSAQEMEDTAKIQQLLKFVEQVCFHVLMYKH